MKNPEVIRNRQKIEAAILNAKAFIKTKNEFGSFAIYIWQFTQNKPIVNKWKNIEDIPVYTKESILISNNLRKRGFIFVGPTICYAFMQTIGMVNDHLVDCFRHEELTKSIGSPIMYIHIGRD